MAKHDGIWSRPSNPSSLAWSTLMLPVRAVLRTGVAVKAFSVYLRAATSCPKLQALACLWLIWEQLPLWLWVSPLSSTSLWPEPQMYVEREWVPFSRNVTWEDPETTRALILWIHRLCHQCSSQSPPSRSILGERSGEVPGQKQQGMKKEISGT